MPALYPREYLLDKVGTIVLWRRLYRSITRYYVKFYFHSICQISVPEKTDSEKSKLLRDLLVSVPLEHFGVINLRVYIRQQQALRDAILLAQPDQTFCGQEMFLLR